MPDSRASLEIERLARALAGIAQDDPAGSATASASRQRERERDFAGLMALMAPRVARIIRQYRLEDMREDAGQAAAIGVHRALATFVPGKASFATHATWQVRGELQSLRHRMRLDERQSARSAGAVTLSLDALGHQCDTASDAAEPFQIIDDTALPRTESAASHSMTEQLLDRLLDRVGAPATERRLMREHVFAGLDEALPERGRSMALSASRNGPTAPQCPKTKEQRRQIIRRLARNCAKVAGC